jgi:sucrose phosphorylase
VLIDVISVLLLYVRHGTDIIRLDAITYLWEELGTDCASLDQTHEIIKLFRDVLNLVAPQIALLTETNVPHDENVSYFGNGHDEAQMVYNFALPPLVLHTFYTEDTTALSRWAVNLVYPSKTTTFFNILDTHDGVGLSGVKNILSEEEINEIVRRATEEHNAFVSYKTGQDGKEEPYEINTTWFGALNRRDSREELAFQVKRFVASRSIALVLKGVPAIYFHGMIGTGNDPEVVKRSGHNRDINRTVIDEKDLDEARDNPGSKLSLIRQQLKPFGYFRAREKSFHPNGEQKVIMISPSVFSVLRISPEGNERILTITNVTGKKCDLEIKTSQLGNEYKKWYDLINKKEHILENKSLSLTLQPYDVVWLKAWEE